MKNKEKKSVLNRRSLLEIIPIAEKKLYDSIQKFIFFNGIFFPFGNTRKKIPRLFDF